MTISFDDFIKKWLGKKCDWDGYFSGQCVDLFRQYVQEVLALPQPKGVGGAKDFWTNFDTDQALFENYEKIPNTPDGVPQKGDVVIWNGRAGGGYGHVAMFVEGDVNGFTSFDENWPTLDKCTLTKHNYTNVSGWFHPTNEMDCETALIEMRASRDKWKNQCEEDKEKYAQDIADKTQHIELMQRTMAEQNVQISSLNETIQTSTSEKSLLSERCVALEAKIVDMTTSFENQKIVLDRTITDLMEDGRKKVAELTALKEKCKSGLEKYSFWEKLMALLGRK
jgi:hypothetical protein